MILTDCDLEQYMNWIRNRLIVGTVTPEHIQVSIFRNAIGDCFN